MIWHSTCYIIQADLTCVQLFPGDAPSQEQVSGKWLPGTCVQAASAGRTAEISNIDHLTEGEVSQLCIEFVNKIGHLFDDANESYTLQMPGDLHFKQAAQRCPPLRSPSQDHEGVHRGLCKMQSCIYPGLLFKTPGIERPCPDGLGPHSRAHARSTLPHMLKP